MSNTIGFSNFRRFTDFPEIELGDISILVGCNNGNNTQNPNQCSSQENTKLQNSKWEKSLQKHYENVTFLY